MDYSIQYTSQLPIMKWYAPHLLSIADAGHVWKFRDGYRSYCTLFLSLILCSLPVATVAFAPVYGTPTQCGEFGFSWRGPGVPFVVLILPFDAQPVVFLPNLYDSKTQTWADKLVKLPLKSGTQFIVVLDYGYGAIHSSPV